MDKKNKLVLQWSIFFIFVICSFAYIVINEKKYIIITPKIEKKMLKYIDKKFAKEKIDLDIGKIKYKKDNKTYTIKLSNHKNRNHYFYTTYKNKKITNTYKKDYLEGKSLFNFYANNYSKKFKKGNLKFTKKLNKYPSTIKDEIIKNAKGLKVYNISIELPIKGHSNDIIGQTITKFYNKNKKFGYNPKYYQIILVDKDDISFSVQINYLTDELISNNLNEIITSIIHKDKNIEKKYSIKYEYIN